MNRTAGALGREYERAFRLQELVDLADLVDGYALLPLLLQGFPFQQACLFAMPLPPEKTESNWPDLAA
jgi:hypothetical protein